MSYKFQNYGDGMIGIVGPEGEDYGEVPARILVAAKDMHDTLQLCQRWIGDLMTKGKVPWGQTCGLDFALMNETLLALRDTLGKVEKP